MPILVDCPCGKKFRARDELSGKRVKCPACGQVLPVPSAKPAPPTTPTGEIDMDALFRDLIQRDGSNLHVKAGRPAIFRIQGVLQDQNMEPFDEEQVEGACFGLMDQRQREIFEHDGGTDLAHVVEHDGQEWRFRVNIFRQMGKMALIAQTVPPTIPTFEQLHLPGAMQRLCTFDQGMIVVAGMTGCGKTTTIASMLDWINHNYEKHILTIEDPVEYVFHDDKCSVTQREIGTSVPSFEIAMKHAVREDPDVILVGEMRDMESFLAAMHAAETGHLVFGTIHSATAPSTIGRILDLFPQNMHSSLRSSLAFNMRAIIVQKLVPTVRDDPRVVPAVEIMLFNAMIKKLILEDHDEKLVDAMAVARAEGMQQFNDSLYDFVERDYINHEAAFRSSPSAEQLKMLFKGISVKSGGIL